MALDIAHFVRLRPYAFHITARENLDALRRTGALEPAATLMRRAGRADLLRWRRPTPVALMCGTEPVIIQGQAQLIESNVALSRGWSFGDFLEYVNEHVYFWPGTAEGPIKSGRHLSGRDEDPASLVLRIPAGDLLDSAASRTPLFCAYNTGSTRLREGRRVPHGPHLFSESSDFARRESEVVEIAFRSRVSLPRSTAVLQRGEWTPLASV